MGFGSSLNPFGSDDYETLRVDESLINSIERPEGRHVLRIKPSDSGPGWANSTPWIHEFHKVKSSFSPFGGDAPRYSWEILYDNGRVSYLASATERDDIEDALEAQYPGATIQDIPGSGFIDMQPGEYVACAKLTLSMDCVYPIRDTQTTDPVENDPYASIIPKVVGREDERAYVQVVFSPVGDDWFDRGVAGTSGGIIAEQRQEGHSEGQINPRIVKSDADKDAARDIQSQAGRAAFQVTIRIFAVAPDAGTARARAKKIETIYNQHYHHVTGQEFVAKRVSGTDIASEIEKSAARDHTSHSRLKSALYGKRNILTDRQLGMLAHPTSAKHVSHHRIDYQTSDPGRGIPPGTARYDFDAAGIPEAGTEVKATTMMDHPEHGDDAFWFGFGRKTGTEAGVFEEFLNAHMQVTGRTRMGKTTFGTNVGSQIMQRDYGCLAIMLGKEDDDVAFIAEWPEDRPEEDFVFIDTGDDFPKRARFNLLEIPEELEPGTAEHTSYMESLADEFCAAFAQAGGDGESLYPLMRGITRTLVRGMSQSGHVCTPIDLAAACSSSANMSKFSQWMSEERIMFIKETARRFEEKEDADLEPIARRMDEITHNANLRNWLAAREPTVRIQDIVDEQKVAVLRIDPALGETERKFAINPVVRRFAHAVKMSDVEDPFYFIWDEADKALTIHSNLEDMLSEYGGYGARFILLYQAPSNQLNESLKDATESQIDTTVSFRTTGKDAAFISNQHSIDADSLRSLPRFSFYMSTDTRDNDPTHSFMVDAFPPARAMRERVADISPRTPEEIEAMKERSSERYGAVPPSDEEIKAESPFLRNEPQAAAQDAEEDSGFEVTEHVRAQVCTAVFDEAIRQDSEDGWVHLDPAQERILRYVPEAPVSTTEQLWGRVVEKIPTTHLERESTDGEMYLRCTEEGLLPIFAQGDKQNAAGPLHRELLNNAYRPLTELGFVVEIPQQGGDSMPDALAHLDDVELLQFDEDASPKEIHDAYAEFESNEEYAVLDYLSGGETISVEAEESTGASAPAQTIVNLSKCLSQGRRCLFLARTREIAETVWEHLAEDPVCMRPTSLKGTHRLYNTNADALRIDDKAVYRPGSAGQTKWLYEYRTGEYVLSDSEDEEHARFESAAEIFDDPSMYPAVEGSVDRSAVASGEWMPVKPPAVPEVLFDGGAPDQSLWTIVVPDESTDSGFVVYTGDGVEPLFDVVGVSGSANASGESVVDSTLADI